MATVKMVALAQFIASKAGATGLTVTCDVDEYDADNSSVDNAYLTAQSMTHVRNGIYRLFFDGDESLLYVATAKTADSSVDQQHIPAVVVRLDRVNNADVKTSTRNAVAPLDASGTQTAAEAALTAYDAATGADVAAISVPSAATVADAVASVDPAGYGVNTAGYAWAAAGSSADPLLNPVPGSYTQPQAGYYLGRLANNEIELTAVFDPTTLALSYYFGDDYAVEENRQQDFTTTLDLTGAAVDWRVRTATGVVVVVCSIEDATTYRLAPTAAELATIGVGRWAYDLEITLANGHVVTEIKGLVTITQDVR